MNESSEGIDAAVAQAEASLEHGEPLSAYNAAQQGLALAPAHPRLRQLQALALARSGDTARANAMLAALAREGFDDAETLGMLARTHKDLAIASHDPASRKLHLDEGFKLYEGAYERARRERRNDAAWYTGINAATLAILRGDARRGRKIASQVRDICLAAESPYEKPSERYWREATLGEAALILGDTAAAIDHYARARAVAGRRFGDISSTRKQARLLCEHVRAEGFDVNAILAMPPIVIFTGHMIDPPGRGAARFPASLEPVVAEAIRKCIRQLAPIAAYGSAACGVDILCLEAAREAGAETHVVLPFPAAAFHAASVDFAGGDWPARFEKALAEATSVTVASDHHARGSTATFEYANVMLTGMGTLRAQVL
ncbi:MAG: tetratricopeptide repeat-containing protein, partial [Bacillota bacterium]